MSRYTGSIITQSPTTPTGPFATSRAPGIWRLDDVAYWTQQGLWPNAANVPDPYFPNVSMLLSTTSLNNATNNLFVDSSGAFNPVSRFGNPTQGTLSPYGSNWANYFDGTGDNLSISSFPAGLSFGTDDFTIEFWTFPYSSPNNNWSPFFTMGNNGGGQEIRLSQNINGTGWGWLYPNNSNNADVYAGYGTLPINTWHHIAMTRSGSTMRLFLNGAVVATNTGVSFNFTNTTLLRVAMPQPAYADGTYNGYISNLRIVKGTALYTSAFTPSTTPLTAVSGTGLLTCQSNRFRDASSLANTITVNGDPKVIDFGPFSPSSLLAYNQNDVSNWSNYFNGTNSRMSIADNAAFGFGTGSFTVEFWLYYTGGNGYKFFFVNNSGSGNYVGYGLQTGTLTPWVWNGTDVLVASSNITPNSWQHHALVRNGSTLTIYLNGTAIGSTTWTVDLGTSRPFYIGWNGGNDNQSTPGYFSNFRVVKGTAVYTSNFTPPATNLTAISGTSLLTCQNAAFTDNSTNSFAITTSGEVTVTGNSPISGVGPWSNYFDGSSTITFSQINMAGDFTIEGWVYFSGTNSPTVLGANPPNHQSLRRLSSAKHYFYREGVDITGTIDVPLNQWVHLAATRSSGTVRIFTNGVLDGSRTITGTFSLFCLGGVDTGTDRLTGYTSNMRVVDGTALYTSNFAVPTTPLTAVSGTVLLTSQNGSFVDNSTSNRTLTRNGSPTVQSFDPFYTSTVARNGGSMYFDGSGDYLRCPSNPAFSLGTASYTVEFYIYTISTTSQMVFDTIQPGISGGGSNRFYVLVNSSQQVVVGPATNTLTSTSTIRLGAWNHVAVVRNGTTRTIYINGVSAGSNTQSEDLSSNFCTIGFDAALSGTIIMNGYLSDLRVTKGTALYTTSFTPPTAPLTPSASTSLLANGMNAGAYDATTISDFETAGNAQVRYFIGNYYGGSFDGSGDYLATGTSSAIALGTADFTFECWVYPSAFPNDSTLVYAGGTSTGNEISLQIRNNQVASHLFISGGHSDVQFTDLPVQLNRWSHLAISRVSGVLYGFLNGVRSSVAPALTTNFGSSGVAYVAVGDRYAGIISNARMTKNAAVYSTATYTVPTAPLTATANTAFLTCQNTTFVDNSPNALAITAFGNATAGATGPFTYTGGASVFFDNNSSNRVKAVSNPIFAVGTGNFTVEAWIYVTNRSTENFVFDTRASGATAGMGFSLEPGTGKLRYSGNVNNVLTSTGVTANNWTHVAWVRNGTTLTGYINGVAGGSASNSDNLTQSNGEIGNIPYSSVASNMYVNNLRVTRGVARYTTDFTPPTRPFPNY